MKYLSCDKCTSVFSVHNNAADVDVWKWARDECFIIDTPNGSFAHICDDDAQVSLVNGHMTAKHAHHILQDRRVTPIGASYTEQRERSNGKKDKEQEGTWWKG